ncbi:hypothetical protein BO225_11290, partial [Dubosiella newyorkensis]
LDWKEDMNFKLKNGETIHINVFSLVYSYSRFKVFYLSLSRKRDVLLHLLDQAFERKSQCQIRAVRQRLRIRNEAVHSGASMEQGKGGKSDEGAG